MRIRVCQYQCDDPYKGTGSAFIIKLRMKSAQKSIGDVLMNNRAPCHESNTVVVMVSISFSFSFSALIQQCFLNVVLCFHHASELTLDSTAGLRSFEILDAIV